MKHSSLAAALLPLITACASNPSVASPSLVSSSDAGDDGEARGSDADRFDAPASDVGAADAHDEASSDQPFGCGSATCLATQYCVTPCLPCGGPPACVAADDAGVCPPGSLYRPGICAGMPFGRVCEPQCNPLPPYCVDDPSQACGGGNSTRVGREIQCTQCPG
jgi:hypothetical protein